MEFEWDDAKNAINQRKHGVAFELVRDFDWRSAQIAPDDRLNYGEDRLLARGFIGTRLYVAIFVLRGGATRLISLRKANRREQRLHEFETGTKSR